MLNCPYCNRPIGEPYEIKTKFGSSFTGGRCECGAVYAYDRGGHSLGEAYVDALAFACDDDWDRAWSLIPEEDYDIQELGFDQRRNKFSSSPKKSRPTYLFIRLKR